RYDVDLPRIAPYEIWRTLTKPEVVAVGNPAGLLQVYLGYLKQYEDLTGVSAPRLGAQTKSHTTAFAVDAEITRGLVRTVDGWAVDGATTNQLPASAMSVEPNTAGTGLTLQSALIDVLVALDDGQARLALREFHGRSIDARQRRAIETHFSLLPR
ncbi:MAG: hypothetical protein HUU28_10865, partial [Planctomycetaceae bacterium]|nr:hypothetical protein [Planctomycetaceae bacterium]